MHADCDGFRNTESAIAPSALSVRAVDHDHAGFVLEQSANRIGAKLPRLRELLGRKMSLESRRNLLVRVVCGDCHDKLTLPAKGGCMETTKSFLSSAKFAG